MRPGATERKTMEHCQWTSERTSSKTHLLATLTVLPALVAENRQAALLSGDTLLLLERCAEGAGGDLGVLVVPAKRREGEKRSYQSREGESFGEDKIDRFERTVEGQRGTYVKTLRQVALLIVADGVLGELDGLRRRRSGRQRVPDSPEWPRARSGAQCVATSRGRQTVSSLTTTTTTEDVSPTCFLLTLFYWVLLCTRRRHPRISSASNSYIPQHHLA